MLELNHVHHGDNLALLRQMPDNCVHAVVTDPPYGLSFMGKRWDYDVPSVEQWAEVLRVLKPGGHLLSFAGTRTQHRMAVNIEDAGFEIRDLVMWVYGSGFPKSLDVSKAIDKRGGAQVAWFGPWFRKWREDNGVMQKQVAALFPSKTGGLTGCVANWELGFNMPTPEQFNLIRDTFGLPFATVDEAEREVVGQDTKARSTSGSSALPTVGGSTVYQSWDITAPATDAAKHWQGFGTALKPAVEPITLARKPLDGTVAENVQRWGTGGLDIDGCRVGMRASNESGWSKTGSRASENRSMSGANYEREPKDEYGIGRWPANLIHDGSDEVVGLFPGEEGESAARFFYVPKPSSGERDEGCEGLEMKTLQAYGDFAGTPEHAAKQNVQARNHHPTVKPVELMEYLVRLISREGQIVLDPWGGSGTTGVACKILKRQFILMEREAEYVKIAEARIGAKRQMKLL